MSPQSRPPSFDLTGAQRRHLRALAHERKPVVMVGEAGITDAVVAALDDALASHELVKVRIRQPENKKSMAQELAQRGGAHLCGVVGHTVILYRPDPEEPRLELPGQ